MKPKFFPFNLRQPVARSFNPRRRALWAAVLLTTLLLAGTAEALVTFVKTWGSPGRGDGEFFQPIGVAVNSAGQVYVTDFRNYRIQKFDANGNFIEKWGSQGTGGGQFEFPIGIAVDSSGNVYVCDINIHNLGIQKFTPTATFSAN